MKVVVPKTLTFKLIVFGKHGYNLYFIFLTKYNKISVAQAFCTLFLKIMCIDNLRVFSVYFVSCFYSLSALLLISTTKQQQHVKIIQLKTVRLCVQQQRSRQLNSLPVDLVIPQAKI